MSAASPPAVVDAACHPAPRDDAHLRSYMPQPWRERFFPPAERYWYPAPDPEQREEAVGSAGGAPGSDPELLARQLLDEAGVDVAILLPLTRGLLPDLDLGAAVCAATNAWLAEEWLDAPAARGRFRGSIRVDPSDPPRAVAEIERWARHPRMVQVAVPLQSLQPYGQRRFAPVWEAAARHDLPVAVHADGGGGVELWPTCAGYPTHYVEYAAQLPLTFAIHLFSLVAEGMLERVENLRFVFADGGLDMLAPLLWRFEKDWRPARHETPWVTRRPSDYVAERVRFCASALEGPTTAADVPRWLAASDAATLQLFASDHPARDRLDAATALAGAPPEVRRRVLGENARAFYDRL